MLGLSCLGLFLCSVVSLLVVVFYYCLLWYDCCLLIVLFVFDLCIVVGLLVCCGFVLVDFVFDFVADDLLV